jgi:hypothetical protein
MTLTRGGEEFISQRQAYKRFGVSPVTLRDRVRKGQLQAFINPLDERTRLIRVKDIETMLQLRPAGTGEAAQVAI